jgi:uncharacterized membrane protein YfcA
VGFSVLTRPQLLVPLCIAVIAGTWTGKHINKGLDAEQFVRVFKATLIALSLKLIYDGVRGFGWI